MVFLEVEGIDESLVVVLLDYIVFQDFEISINVLEYFYLGNGLCYKK